MNTDNFLSHALGGMFSNADGSAPRSGDELVRNILGPSEVERIEGEAAEAGKPMGRFPLVSIGGQSPACSDCAKDLTMTNIAPGAPACGTCAQRDAEFAPPVDP